MKTRRALLLVAALFLLVRAATIVAYRDTYYFYGMIASQFAIAEAAYRGHAFAQDATLASTAADLARRERRFVAIDEWKGLNRSGHYTTFLAQDLPGYGYLIAATSRWFSDRLTSRYAMLAQLLVEFASLLLFAGCVAASCGRRIALLTALAYPVAYVFVWPMASLPMRDIFSIGTFAALMTSCFLFLKCRGPWSLLGSISLMAFGSLLLWVRPSGYQYGALLALLVMFSGKSWWAKVGFSGLLLVLPWLIFGYPYRQFNVRHYGVADADFMGRVLWAHMGIIKENPYGFVLRDDAFVPWIHEYYGRTVEYGSVEMNRLLGEYARKVIREDPEYFLRTLGKRAVDMAKTPLDMVAPVPVVAFEGSARDIPRFAQDHTASFLYRVLNRVVLTSFFYGGLLLSVWLVVTKRVPLLEFALLMSPLAYTLAVQVFTAFEQRYMATGAWVLILPWVLGLHEWNQRRQRPSHPA